MSKVAEQSRLKSKVDSLATDENIDGENLRLLSDLIQAGMKDVADQIRSEVLKSEQNGDSCRPNESPGPGILTGETEAPTPTENRESASGWAFPRALASFALLWAAGSANNDYLMLRFIVCAVAVHTSYKAKVRQEIGWAWIMAILAILFNPFLVLHLDAGTWVLADWIAIALIGISLKSHVGVTDSRRRQ